MRDWGGNRPDTGRPGRRQGWRAAGALAICSSAILATGPAAAQSIQDLGRLSIEELSTIEITSVSRRPETLAAAPAAVYALSHDEIQRSAAGTLTEALRQAPNLAQAQQNNFTTAISARGFNSTEASNKLLVLIDGRSVYSPVESRVYWDAVQVMLDDVERIEVISGPGSTLYGANAVNGVINVVTRSARDTQGGLVNLRVGSRDQSLNARYGGKLSEEISFRVYGMGLYERPTKPYSATDTSNDAWRSVQAGFRADADYGRDKVTLQSDLYRNRAIHSSDRTSGGNLLGRWTREFSADSSLQVQAYYDVADRVQPGLNASIDTYDLQLQHNWRFSERHQLVWGGEYRLWSDHLVSPFFPRPKAQLTVANLFVQDEITLASDLKLTLGVKGEDSNYSGFDLLPSARVAWMVAPQTLLWGAVSRAVRTPSRVDRELAFPGFLMPAPDFKSERLTAYEIGMRLQPTSRATLSVSAFYNRYNDLRSTGFGPTIIPLQLTNDVRGHTYGVEAWGSYALLDWWRIGAGISTLKKHFTVKPGLVDLAALQSTGVDPNYRLQFRSEMNLTDTIQLDVAMRRVGRSQPAVKSYGEADLRLGWRASKALELSLEGTNLLHARHLEAYDVSQFPARYIPRAVQLRARVAF